MNLQEITGGKKTIIVYAYRIGGGGKEKLLLYSSMEIRINSDHICM
jgi:hypothetical protein